MLEKEHWINGHDNGCEIKKEVWDGARYAELAWFWNLDEKVVFACKMYQRWM